MKISYVIIFYIFLKIMFSFFLAFGNIRIQEFIIITKYTYAKTESI